MMRSTVLIWVFTIAVCAAGLSVAGSRYYAAISRHESARARLVEAQASRIRLASLRATLPAWTTLRPTEGLAPRVADSLAACGLPSSVMSNLSAQAETLLAALPSESAPSPRDLNNEPGSERGIKSRKAGVTLTPITLSELGRFIAAWREREPAWVIASIDVAPLNASGHPVADDRRSSSSADSKVPPSVQSNSGGGGGGELPLRVVLSLESLWLTPPVAPIPAAPSVVIAPTMPASFESTTNQTPRPASSVPRKDRP